jgi:L,D-transpeptidase YcbB
MDLVEQGETRMSMPVVVGRRYHATPVFTGLMTYLVFSPYWNIPPGISSRVIIPNIRQDPEYLEREAIRVFRGWEQPATPVDPDSIDWSGMQGAGPFRFRQDPGPANALGGVKFMFPNKYHVYMHDTPAKELFDRSSRDFSNGCIRLKEPLRLAEYLLQEQEGWDSRRIASAAQLGSEQTVRLSRSWPVHILYWTAWVGPDHDVNFRPDVYGRDERLAEVLYD